MQAEVNTGAGAAGLTESASEASNAAGRQSNDDAGPGPGSNIGPGATSAAGGAGFANVHGTAAGGWQPLGEGGPLQLTQSAKQPKRAALRSQRAQDALSRKRGKSDDGQVSHGWGEPDTAGVGKAAAAAGGMQQQGVVGQGITAEPSARKPACQQRRQRTSTNSHGPGAGESDPDFQ